MNHGSTLRVQGLGFRGNSLGGNVQDPLPLKHQ